MASFYEELLRELAAHEVRFVIVGGIAVILQGVPRTTADVDLVLDLDPANVRAFLGVVARLGYRPRAPVPAEQLADPDAREGWIREKGMKAFSFHRSSATLEEVDVLIETPLDYAGLMRDRTLLSAHGLELSVASIDALIAMKTGTGRAQDEADVDALRRLKEALAR